jgi:hypothetical protein
MMPDPDRYITPVGQLEVQKCRMRGCGADVIWIVTPTGARLCVDAKGRPDLYAIVLSPEGPRGVRTRAVIDATWSEADARETDRVFLSHWATCKNPPGRRS